jgi:hypothetical protein
MMLITAVNNAGMGPRTESNLPVPAWLTAILSTKFCLCILINNHTIMSGDYHHLPILPASSSLTSHLQALDLLAARLSSLATKTEWETRVPLNSKASIKGSLTNTANVKINIGGEWWVDMTVQEGEAWVRRRKAGTS